MSMEEKHFSYLIIKIKLKQEDKFTLWLELRSILNIFALNLDLIENKTERRRKVYTMAGMPFYLIYLKSINIEPSRLGISGHVLAGTICSSNGL